MPTCLVQGAGAQARGGVARGRGGGGVGRGAGGGHETLQEDAVPLAHDVRARAGHMSGTYILFSRSHDDLSRV